MQPSLGGLTELLLVYIKVMGEGVGAWQSPVGPTW